jgi:hypothetical protein
MKKLFTANSRVPVFDNQNSITTGELGSEFAKGFMNELRTLKELY